MASGDEILVVARVGRASPFGMSIHVRQRLPLVPPLGTPYVAWSPPAVVDAWIRRAGGDLDDADVERYRRAVADVRSRGYSVTLDDDVRRRLGETVERLADQPGATALRSERDRLIRELRHHEYLLLELEASRTYPVTQISAPVFGRDGRVILVVGVVGFPHQLQAQQVPEIAQRLLGATASITEAVGGRPPPTREG